MTELYLGFKLMIFGLGSVFVALILFYLLIKALNYIFPPIDPSEIEK